MAVQKVPINPAVLAWAIKESGRDASDLAASAGASGGDLAQWLSGEAQPGVTQFRKLSNALKRPSAVLLLPAPPKTAVPRVEFRHAPGERARKLNPKELLRMRETGRLQRGLRWVLRELEDDGVALPKISPSADAEAAASRLRALLGVSVATQLGWKSEYVAFREWRAAVENLGIAVLALPMGADSARGFSAWDDHVPAITINTHWGPTARIFTLFHELGHLISRTSSVCDESFVSQRKDSTDPVERWCESFAAALLLPWPEVERFLKREFRWDGRTQITDLSTASKLARRFRVSLRATVLRLIGKESASWTLYRAISPTTEMKHTGGGGSGRTRPEARFDEYGRRTARVLLQGLERDVLSRDDVLAYLNIGDSELSNFQKEAMSA